METIPFAEILYVFAVVASHDLTRSNPDLAARVDAVAMDDARVQLTEELAGLAAQTLFLEMQIFFRLSAASPLGADTQRYAAYIRHLRTGGFRELCASYPVMARLLATIAVTWIASIASLLAAFLDDRLRLSSTLGVQDLRISRLRLGLSDRHHGGRSVAQVTFNNGIDLLYKPRDTRVDAAFLSFLNWCNTASGFTDFQVPRLFASSTHGWMEFVPHARCGGAHEFAEFYRRAGHLLCCLYLLRGTDFHAENLVAHGAFPVLVDLEMLFTPVMRRLKDDRNAFTDAIDYLETSVLSTGLLPQWFVAAPGVSFDVSGLGSHIGYRAPVERWSWKHVATDNMRVVKERSRQNVYRNTPEAPEGCADVLDYVDSIEAGFAQMYEFLRGRRETLLSAASPLHAFRGVAVRVALRRTRVYARLLRRAAHPKYLRDGLSRSVLFDLLSKTFTLNEVKPPQWAVVEVERDALERLDIPYFHTDVDSVSLYADREVVAGCFREPGRQLVYQTLRSMSSSHLETQIKFIRESYSSLESNAAASGSSRGAVVTSLLEDAVPCVDSQALTRYACAIADKILAGAFVLERGVTWIAQDYNVDGDVHQFQALGPSLYSGHAGIGLFLAAVTRVTRHEKYGDAARAALVPIVELATGRALRRFAATAGLGALTGVGSLLYVLVRSAEWLGEPLYLAAASELAEGLGEAAIEKAGRPDFVSGVAGLLHALLVLHRGTGSARALDLAKVCGERLLATRQQIGSGVTWLFDRRALAGFSHGASGIAFSLLGLYDETGDPRYPAAAVAAFDFERGIYSELEGNWPDLRRSTGRPRFVNAWCHGAPGIALSRLLAVRHLNDRILRQDLENALHRTAVQRPQEIDHLCCGNLGRAEVLLVASDALGDGELRRVAFGILADVLKNAQTQRGYRLLATVPCSQSTPGFMRGLAGVGYEMLRFAVGNELPSVVMLA